MTTLWTTTRCTLYRPLTPQWQFYFLIHYEYQSSIFIIKAKNFKKTLAEAIWEAGPMFLKEKGWEILVPIKSFENPLAQECRSLDNTF